MKLLDARVELVASGEPSRNILEGIEISLEEGEFLVVTGASGSGKSLLGRLVAGGPTALSGLRAVATVSFAGGGSRPPGFVGYVGPDPRGQLVGSTLLEDVSLGPGCLGVPADTLRASCEAALEAVGLGGFEERHPETLSGGEAQRAALAAVLALRPRVLILDEALAEMDPPGRRRVLALLRAHAEGGGAAVLLSSDPREAAPLADRVLRLGGGMPLGPWEALAGRSPAAASSDPGPAVSASGLTYSFPGGRGCRGVDLEVGRGELVGLAGPNGSGKTTLLRLALGLVSPGRGRLRVLGREPGGRRGHHLRRRMAVVPQDPDLRVCRPSLLDELSLDGEIRGWSREGARRWAAGILGSVGLGHRSQDHPLRLSRGERRLACAAAAWGLGAELVVADEPVAGMAPRDAAAVYAGFRSLADRGAAVLVVSHDHRGLAAAADRIVHLTEGRVTSVEDPCGDAGEALRLRAG